MTGKELAQAFCDELYYNGFNYREFAEYVTKEHREVQNRAFTAFKACMVYWSQAGDNYDDRNSEAVEFSKKNFPLD